MISSIVVSSEIASHSSNRTSCRKLSSAILKDPSNSKSIHNTKKPSGLNLKNLGLLPTVMTESSMVSLMIFLSRSSLHKEDTVPKLKSSFNMISFLVTLSLNLMQFKIDFKFLCFISVTSTISITLSPLSRRRAVILMMTKDLLYNATTKSLLRQYSHRVLKKYTNSF